MCVSARNVCGSSLGFVCIRRRCIYFRLQRLWRQLQWICLVHFLLHKAVIPTLLVVSDRFAKLTRTIPLGRTREFEVANAFAKLWAFVYGAPSSLLTGNDPPFNSKLYQKVCNQLGINCLFTTTYHPRAIEQPSDLIARSLLRCDRTFRTILIFRKLVPTQWLFRTTRKSMRLLGYSHSRWC